MSNCASRPHKFQLAWIGHRNDQDLLEREGRDPELGYRVGRATIHEQRLVERGETGIHLSI
jgi:hypothetical protein